MDIFSPIYMYFYFTYVHCTGFKRSQTFSKSCSPWLFVLNSAGSLFSGPCSALYLISQCSHRSTWDSILNTENYTWQLGGASLRNTNSIAGAFGVEARHILHTNETLSGVRRTPVFNIFCNKNTGDLSTVTSQD